MEKGWLHTEVDGNATYYYFKDQPGDPRISGNVSVTTRDYWCYGQIKGDPDIAGMGVLIGVNAASCIAVLASILAFWIPYAVEHWGRAAITSNGTESNTGTEPAAPKSATATATAISEGSSIQATLSRRKTTHTEAEFFISGAPTPTYPRPPKKQPNGLTSTEQFIFNLGDLNLATSLAIIISSMVNIHTNPHYPLYHIFIARALASSAIIGHNSTTFVYTKFQQKRTYSLWIRWFLSLSALVLYTIWCGQALSKFQEQDKQREWKFMPFCLSAGGNIVPGSWTGWIWFNRLEMPFTFFWIIMSPFPWSSVVDETIQRLDAFTFGRFRAIIVDYWKDVSWIGQEQRQATAWNYVTTFVHNFLVAAVKTLLTLLWILVCVLLIPCDSVMPLSQGLFGILWNIYDIYTIRKGNAGVVVNVLSTPDWPNTENPEEKWGFGQIFPVVMLLQIFITFLDYALEFFNDRFPMKNSTTRSARAWPRNRLQMPARRGTRDQIYRMPWELPV